MVALRPLWRIRPSQLLPSRLMRPTAQRHLAVRSAAPQPPFLCGLGTGPGLAGGRAAPGGGPFLRLFIPWPEPRSPSRRERRSGAGQKGPKGPRRIRQPAWPRCSAARRGAAAPQPPPPGDSSAGLLLPGRHRSHPPAPGTAESGLQNGEAAAESMAMNSAPRAAQRRDRSQRRSDARRASDWRGPEQAPFPLLVVTGPSA